ncbi:MAG: hypothetical protein KKG35_16320, partial [Proteobacteria bacterium]|nr:hypothetical protein [Pseudomonadota bacterium]
FCISFPMSRSRAPQAVTDKTLELFEPEGRVFQRPVTDEEHRVSRPRRDKWPGAFSFGSFSLGMQRKRTN